MIRGTDEIAERTTLPPGEGERKVVTVLFADIVRSSEIVAGNDPEDANNALLAIIETLIDSVHQFGGRVVQVLGDGIMAVFGAPAALEDHALRACLAAERMQGLLGPGLRGTTTGVDRPAQIRVGISSGEVVAQYFDTGWRAEYRLAGDVVHLAARAERVAAPGRVCLTETTVRLAAPYVEARPRQAYGLTVAARPVTIFELLAIRSRAAAPSAQTKPAGFFGRSKEILLLGGALAAAEAGTGKVLVVSGEAGLGKTRLADEFVESDGVRRARVVRCEVPRPDLAGSTDPMASLVKALMTLEARDHGPATLAAVLARLGVGGARAQAALGDILGQPASDPSWKDLDPSDKLAAVVGAVADLVLAASRSRLVLLVVDDFHWADSAMRMLIDALARRGGGHSLLVLLTCRNDGEKTWAGCPNVVEHELAPLSREASFELLGSILGPAADLDDIGELLVDKTQGNPLFLGECVRALKDTGYLIGTPGRVQSAHQAVRLEIPATIHGVLACRIDRLAPLDRDLLLIASVIGQSFDIGLLQDLTGIAGQTLLLRLSRLVASGFIERTRVMPNLEFTFRHALIHDVAYGTLLRRRRRALHSQLVAAIRARPTYLIPNKIEALAHHALRAESWPRAYAYGRRAGLNAQARSRNREALRFFEMALAAGAALPKTTRNLRRGIAIRLSLARSLFPLGKHEQARTHLIEAQELAHLTADRCGLSRVLSQMTLYHWINGDYEQAVRSASEARAIGRDLRDAELDIQLTVRMGSLLVDWGRYGAAHRLLEAADKLIPASAIHARFGGLVISSVVRLTVLARTLGELGRFDEAIRLGDEGIRIADEAGHAFSQIHAAAYVGHALLRKGDFERSLPLLERGLRLCRATASRLLFPRTACALGYALARSGDVEAGLPLIEEGVSAAERSTGIKLHSQELLWLAEAYLLDGRLNEALSSALKARDIATRRQEKGHEAWSHWVLAEIQGALRESSRDVERSYRTALAIASAHRMAPLAAHCLFGLGKHYLREKRRDAATAIREAMSRYHQLDMPYWRALVELETDRSGRPVATVAAPAAAS